MMISTGIILVNMKSRNLLIYEMNAKDFAHEIRTPLNTIKVMIGMVLNSDISSEDKKYLNIALKSVDIISEFSAMGVEDVKTETTLYDIITSSITQISVLAKDKNITILTKKSELGETSKILLSKRQSIAITHAMINLLSNGVKFAPHNAEINVRYSNNHVYVSDTGAGIKRENRSKLFNIGERLKSEKEGEGIGLALSKRMMMSVKGDVCLLDDTATIFDITLPAIN